MLFLLYGGNSRYVDEQVHQENENKFFCAGKGLHGAKVKINENLNNIKKLSPFRL